uniref:Uncharacterized protein n=1 Tax=Arundo donax TaxID=35708 RepID=A0A0A9AXG0_ARUDO
MTQDPVTTTSDPANLEVS